MTDFAIIITVFEVLKNFKAIVEGFRWYRNELRGWLRKEVKLALEELARNETQDAGKRVVRNAQGGIQAARRATRRIRK